MTREEGGQKPGTSGSIAQADEGEDVEYQTVTIPLEWKGSRLDRVLSRLFPEHSRTRLGQLARSGRVQVDGIPRRASWRVMGNERVCLQIPILRGSGNDRPEPIPLNVVYEDADLIVLDKPAGLSVHPGAGRPSGTLLNALLAYDSTLAGLPRAGLVHRLDRDTTGLLLVARQPLAYQRLVAELAERNIHRTYEALVWGTPPPRGVIDAPLGRHPVHRTRRSVIIGGRPARTHYAVVKCYDIITRLSLSLETGRTHQIRVHLAYLGHPVVGDPVYGRSHRMPMTVYEPLSGCLAEIRRQMLHAALLEFRHPRTERLLTLRSPLPADMARLIELLERRESGARG